jgi:hypothetical protein
MRREHGNQECTIIGRSAVAFNFLHYSVIPASPACTRFKYLLTKQHTDFLHRLTQSTAVRLQLLSVQQAETLQSLPRAFVVCRLHGSATIRHSSNMGFPIRIPFRV